MFSLNAPRATLTREFVLCPPAAEKFVIQARHARGREVIGRCRHGARVLFAIPNSTVGVMQNEVSHAMVACRRDADRSAYRIQDPDPSTFRETERNGVASGRATLTG